MEITKLDFAFFSEHKKFSDCKPKIKQLFALGNINILEKKILWIVGPRQKSSYADQILEVFFEKAKWRDFATISGLARGVDQKCHTLSLHTDIPTIAILGGGIQRYLKTTDRHLVYEIIEKWGLILSEFDLDFEPTTRSFPLRNRIIASLSDALFLPEAREGSWSLITVNYAIKIKKPVFIAPNPLFNLNGEGSNQLLSEGKGQLLSNFSQILAIFGEEVIWKEKDKADELLNKLTTQEKYIFTLIKQYPNQELSTRIHNSELDIWDAMTNITLLEMKGIIRQSWPGIYITN